jgi:hypothetical protein
MAKRLGFALALAGLIVSVFVLSFNASLVAQRRATRIVSTKGECEDDLSGEYDATVYAIPGDGNRHAFSVRAPNRTSRLLGAYIKTKRNLFDPDFNAECPVNPEQPATPANSDKRRCEEPSNDMSVEYCRFVGGSDSAFTCEFVNSSGQNGPKDIQIFA